MNIYRQDAFGGLEIRYGLKLTSVSLSVPEDEDLQKEFEVEALGRTFR